MKLLKRVVPDDFNLFMIGCDHEGSRLRSKKGFDKMINMVKSEYEGVLSHYNYVIHHGDFMDAITYLDRRFDTKSQRETDLVKQLDNSIENLLPIKDNLITVCESNHLFKVRATSMFTERLCEKLKKEGSKVEYGTQMVKIKFIDVNGKQMLNTFHLHGQKAVSSSVDEIERRKINMKLTVKRQLREKCGDAVLMSKGHSHKLLVLPPSQKMYLSDDGDKISREYTLPHYLKRQFVDDNKESNKPKIITDGSRWIHPDDRWYVNAGSFLTSYGDGYSGYAEAAEYDPIELGFAVAKIRNRAIEDVVPIYL